MYIDVLNREEERKRQGLPPRVGIVPYSAVADEEERIEKNIRASNVARTA